MVYVSLEGLYPMTHSNQCAYEEGEGDLCEETVYCSPAWEGFLGVKVTWSAYLVVLMSLFLD